MECLVCLQKIQQNDTVLVAVQAVYNGPCDDDIIYQMGQDSTGGAIHLECLERSGEAARMPNRTVADDAVEENVVQRSNALALLNM